MHSTSQNHGATTAEIKLLFTKQGHFYNYVYFSTTLYSLRAAANEGRKTSWGNWVEGKSTQQRMEAAAENGEESSHSAHANE